MPNRITALALTCIATVSCQSLESRVDDLFRDYAGDARPGAAVLVIEDGQRVLEKTYGVANVETGEPITPATNFRLASITKQFTATAILLLVDDGKLTLDTTLGDLFPRASGAVATVTVRQLLQHQSGLPDYEPLVPENGRQVHDRDVLEMMLGADSLVFEPASQYAYSNSGYAVLAMIVEERSGRSFREFLGERVFAPQGLNATIAYEKYVSEVENRAFGYTVDGERVEFSDQSVWSAVLGDGGVYSSLDDLYTWDQALYRDDIVSPALKKAMFTPSLENYGFGWRVDELNGHARQHHSGSTSGFRNAIQRFPDDRLTVIVLTNRAEPSVSPLAERIAAMFLAR